MSNGYTAEYTRGDHMRLLNAMKGIKRGVYNYDYEKVHNVKKGKYKDKKCYRVVFKQRNGIAKTYGYTTDRNEAEMIYLCAFEAEFQYSPYLHDEIGGGV